MVRGEGRLGLEPGRERHDASMARVVRDQSVRPVEQVRSETDLRTDIRILGVILSEQVRMTRVTSVTSSRPGYIARVIVKTLDSHGYKLERVVEAINHAQKLVAQSNANPA